MFGLQANVRGEVDHRAVSDLLAALLCNYQGEIGRKLLHSRLVRTFHLVLSGHEHGPTHFPTRAHWFFARLEVRGAFGRARSEGGKSIITGRKEPYN